VLDDNSDEAPAKGAENVEVDSMPTLMSAEWPDVKDAMTEDLRTPLLARVFRYPSLTSQASDIANFNVESPRASVQCLAEHRVMRKIRVVAEKTPIRSRL
jgi:hypothetical protein